MSGIELLETVRETYPDLPFVLFTETGSEEVASEAISAGVTDYLQKGGGSEQYALLANRIENAVQAHRTAERAALQEQLGPHVEVISEAGGRSTRRQGRCTARSGQNGSSASRREADDSRGGHRVAPPRGQTGGVEGGRACAGDRRTDCRRVAGTDRGR
jgi:DNA-binding response OmpR family regulator